MQQVLPLHCFQLDTVGFNNVNNKPVSTRLRQHALQDGIRTAAPDDDPDTIFLLEGSLSWIASLFSSDV